MPFGIGFHSAFVWPLPGADGEDHVITLDNGGEPDLIRLSGGLLSFAKHPSPFKDGRLVLDHDMFDADAMIFPEGAGEGLRYSAKGGPTMHFRFDNLPNLALWQKPGRAVHLRRALAWHGGRKWRLEGIGTSGPTADAGARSDRPFAFSVEVSEYGQQRATASAQCTTKTPATRSVAGVFCGPAVEAA
jgi:hypothetical protein